METLIDYKKKIRKISNHRKHKIRNSLGIYDGYKYYRKNKPKGKEYILTESQYFAITRHINNMLVEHLSKGYVINLPFRLGTLELRKYDKSIKIDAEGRIVTNLPIDWEKTLDLWYEDKEARENKELIRIDTPEIFKLYYNKSSANYNNKAFYDFSFNKDLKVKLKQNIKIGIVDAPYLKKNIDYVE